MIKNDFKRVLVIDDDHAMRNLCSCALTSRNYRVSTAAHGIDALRMIKGSAYDLIVSDINMPGLDGLSFYAHAMMEYPYLKDRFLFITGNVSDSLQRSLKDMNVKFLHKPFKVAELLESVNSIIFTDDEAAPSYDAQNGKRLEERYSLSVDCEVYEDRGEERKVYPAKTRNVSRSGVRLIYVGDKLTMDDSTCVRVNINNTGRNCKVVWARHYDGDVFEAGLKFAEPASISSIVNPNRFKQRETDAYQAVSNAFASR